MAPEVGMMRARVEPAGLGLQARLAPGGDADGEHAMRARLEVQAVPRRPVLQVESLSVEIRSGADRLRVVDGVSLTVEEGRTMALVGESGSGKSVTSLAIMGLLSQPPATVTGLVRFRDRKGGEHELSGLGEREMRVFRGDQLAMIFQEPMTSLNPVHPVGEQIAESLLIHRRMTRKERHEAAVAMLGRVGIPEPERRARAYPHELSGGMRQRVMIGMALICEPSLLIADEPTTALDVTIQAQILNDLKGLQRELGMAMLFITHDLGVVAEISQSVAVMYAGQVVETGPTDEILRHPRHPYTKALLAAIPRAHADRRRPLAAIPGTVPDPRRMPQGCRFHPRCQQALAGRCDREAPAFETVVGGRQVRCLRWRDF